MGLDDRQRVMIAGADEMTEDGLGLIVWLSVLGGAIFSIVRVWQEARASF